MVLYEFLCESEACKNYKWEQEMSIKDDSMPACPNCDSNQYVTKLISSSGFILKGNGWFNSGGY